MIDGALVDASIARPQIDFSRKGWIYPTGVDNGIDRVSYQLDPLSRSALAGPNILAQTLDFQRVNNAAVVIGATGKISFYAIAIGKGVTLTTITVGYGSTIAVTPTNQWACLYDNLGNKLAVTNDLGVTVQAASTFIDFTITTPWVTTYAGLYYVGWCVAGSATQPTAMGLTLLGAAAGQIKGSSTLGFFTAASTFTNPASAPATTPILAAGAGGLTAIVIT
jgi:hypothetical protein